MPLALSELIADFANALVAVDGTRAAHKEFQPGIGPFGEADAVRTALAWLKNAKPATYAAATVGVAEGE